VSARRGPLEAAPWPDALEAHAVDGDEAPRLFGYDVDDDLAMHHRFSDVVFLALTGELPDEARARAFEIALVMALPSSVRNAETHAGVLAAFCGATPAGLLATASAVTADAVLRGIEAVLASARDASAALPEDLCAADAGERAWVERLRLRVEPLVDVPLLKRGPRRDVALLAVLHACGLSSAAQLTAAATIARVPCVVAEALPRGAAEFWRYPTTTPTFQYVGDEEGAGAGGERG